ncbi:hypothetical protein BDW59DRAFT_176991 [Aspergillus cavernicola]|uniref:Uncharacterized protein n=1 Tax=Aspergillus cavernicola TaxID=176166 RepID=A0ABR4HC47_9EURO
MSAKAFLADVEDGVVPVDCHEKVIWIAYIYINTGLWIGNSIFNGDFPNYPSPDDFHSFYTIYHALLYSSVWCSYYSPQPPAHAMKLPCWAYNIARTRQRQPSLPLETFMELALCMLETSTARLHTSHPGVMQLYSETQAHFWLGRGAWEPNQFSISVAQGGCDLWESSAGKPGVVKPDIDNPTWKSEVMWCGWLDGRVGWEAWCRGWDGEVSVKKIRGVKIEVEVGRLDFAVRLHVLLGVMQAAVKSGQEREKRIEAEKAGKWLKEALGIMEPYMRIWDGMWPDAEEERREML